MATVDPRHVASCVRTLALAMALSILLYGSATASSEADKRTGTNTLPANPDHFIIAKSAKVVGGGGMVHYHTFLLDDATGETWEMFCAPNGTVEFRRTVVEGLPRAQDLQKPPPRVTEDHMLPPGLWDGLIGALVGGIISAVIVGIFEWRSKRTEVALEIARQFFAQYDELAQVIGLLTVPQQLHGQPNVANMNRVQKFGDWCETVSAVCLERAADRAILRRIGIPGVMKGFLDGAQGATQQAPEVGSAIAKWTNLQKYMRKEDVRWTLNSMTPWLRL